MARVKIILCLLFFLAAGQLCAQETNSTDTASDYQERTERLVSFLQYMLNTVGNANTSTRDKDVIITQSYAKIFRDEDVQIEDDLLENRQVVTNKDVTAYLKDVEFFYSDVSFEFDIINITEETGEDDRPFIKVQLERGLKGLTIEGDSINNRQPRFIEINIDEAADELKIVSIYTTKVSRDEELRAWWNSLSFQWTSIFLSQLGSVDSVTTYELYQLIDLDSLDLSNNTLLVDLSPLQLLDKLEYLNIDNVQARDFSPLRYLGRLESLSVASCGLNNLDALKYARDITYLNLADNPLSHSLDWSKYSKVERLNLSKTGLEDYSFLSQLPQLTHVDLSNNMSIKSTDQLPAMPNLIELDLSQTSISTIANLAYPKLEKLLLTSTSLSELGTFEGVPQLKYLDIQNTSVEKFDELTETTNLEYIQADNSQISQLEAARFMSNHPNALVVVNTRENELWWRGLSPAWKSLLSGVMGLHNSENPSLEQIIRLFNTTELDLSDYGIREHSPLERFNQLRSLNINNTQITSLEFCTELSGLTTLKGSSTAITNLIGLENHPSLKSLDISNTSVDQLNPLANIGTLKELDINQTQVPSEVAKLWQVDHPGQLVLFQSANLERWWNGLSNSNQAQLEKNLPSSSEIDVRFLHQLVKNETLILTGRDIKDLTLTKPFYNLRVLSLTETQITSLVGIEQLTRLEELECSKSPLYDIESLNQLKSLRSLSIRDTPIDDLSPISSLVSLQSLNCSGTNIKNLKGLEPLKSLENIDCSNTQIRNLSPLKELNAMTELTCYNTRLNNRAIANFREWQPQCRVNYY